VVFGLVLMAAGMWLLSRMGVGTSSGTAVRNMIVVGVGVGLTMPTFTLAVQNAFPARQLGVVTASVQFFRSIGATIGVALMGTFLTATLRDELLRDLPAEARAALPPETLGKIDPQVLASPEAQSALRQALAAVPNGEELYRSLLAAMRQALASSIHDVFMLATVVAAGAVIVGLFLREIPLRKDRAESTSAAVEAGKELAAAQLTEVSPIPPQAEPRLRVGQPTHPRT
jgi:hypothetical protein